MRVVAAVLASALVFASHPAVFAENQNEAQPAVQKTIMLDVELKDPYQAYLLGLVPFGASAAASYVGTSRLRWDPPSSVKSEAWVQNLADIGLLTGFLVFQWVASDPAQSKTIPQFLSWAFLATIPLVHTAGFAPYWGKQAVKFNVEHLKYSGFDHEAEAK